MAQTQALVLARLPKCLADITIDYFGRFADASRMASYGQWEDCHNASRAQANAIFSIACNINYPAIAELALHKGANNIDGMLLHMCCVGRFEIVKLLVAHGAIAINSAMAKACQYGHLEIVKLLIGTGRCSEDWSSWFICACAYGHVAIAELMIAKGVDLHYGLRIACIHNQLVIVKFLVANGDLSLSAGLADAIAHGHTEIKNFLIANGAKILTSCFYVP